MIFWKTRKMVWDIELYLTCDSEQDDQSVKPKCCLSHRMSWHSLWTLIRELYPVQCSELLRTKCEKHYRTCPQYIKIRETFFDLYTSNNNNLEAHCDWIYYISFMLFKQRRKKGKNRQGENNFDVDLGKKIGKISRLIFATTIIWIQTA